MNMDDIINATDIPISSDPQQMIGQLARLVEISVVLNSTLELDPLLAYLLVTAVELLDCEAASILLYDASQGELKFAAATGSDPAELADIAVPLEHSLAGSIFKEGKPQLINNVEQDALHFEEVGDTIGFRVDSLLGVPMSIRDQKVGVLEALNKRTGIFTYADTKLLSIIASQAAVAINNARMMQELQEINQQLQAADEMKRRFMAVASHELRTPLGVIMGYATFLKEEAQGELSEHAGSVLGAAMQLRTLVEDMTNMNLLNTGRRDMHLSLEVLQDIIEQARENVAKMAAAQQDTIVLDLPPEPIFVKADRRLRLVFTSLLNNAIRFTPEGGKIHVALSENEKEAHVVVADNGIGIAADDLEKIFEQFYQVEDHLTRSYGGLGLGLSIAQAFVELHEGRIWAESAGLGQGAAFHVVLPRTDDLG